MEGGDGGHHYTEEEQGLIIAVDFDGILCENKFPEIGTPNYDVISSIRELMDMGHEVVLWTTRNGEELDKAVAWCEDRGLHFCSVNEPAPSNDEMYRDKYPTQSRKVYADVYIDDHNLGCVSTGGRYLGGVLKQINNLKGRIV